MRALTSPGRQVCVTPRRGQEISEHECSVDGSRLSSSTPEQALPTGTTGLTGSGRRRAQSGTSRSDTERGGTLIVKVDDIAVGLGRPGTWCSDRQRPAATAATTPRRRVLLRLALPGPSPDHRPFALSHETARPTTQENVNDAKELRTLGTVSGAQALYMMCASMSQMKRGPATRAPSLSYAVVATSLFLVAYRVGPLGLRSSCGWNGSTGCRSAGASGVGPASPVAHPRDPLDSRQLNSMPNLGRPRRRGRLRGFSFSALGPERRTGG